MARSGADSASSWSSWGWSSSSGKSPLKNRRRSPTPQASALRRMADTGSSLTWESSVFDLSDSGEADSEAAGVRAAGASAAASHRAVVPESTSASASFSVSDLDKGAEPRMGVERRQPQRRQRRRRRRRKRKHKLPLRLRPDARLDALGFVRGSPSASRWPDSAPAARTKRAGKWLAMVDKAHAGGKALREMSKAKKRARKGVPAEVRSVVWPALAGADAYVARYDELLLQTPAEPERVQIVKDLHRTFPHHAGFRGVGGPLQSALGRVLSAAALMRNDVGYCQGMASLAGLLLLYMSEAHAFATLVSMCDSGPDAVYDVGAAANLYATPWFMTLFTGALPGAHCVRILDAFLAEGKKILFRIALALTAYVRSAVLACSDMGEAMMAFRALDGHYDLSPDELMAVALDIDLTNAHLDAVIPPWSTT
ncbi:TBC1 domain family member 10B [Thecamonas trahens ATCC 50062]|uniref:TBC1 domain family member 10B n=1 Tax=Thecamonas trahens ATCC 50062 TaxID=461836 RepID=A0A0L0DF04_THETB|nr:TBC1 domain family member 10B [Thecamonas trahens ATCC 50062]KNC49898.1 TBC1 domain family member 10B [Thecamonas trahens ATCC 50062]|eukprot:XP_013757379.1 TBC1 domain family member 10B [Thecamonas trahens ATCC 50062]